ncbi:MAG: hypothetical protein LQ345_003872 [Seirophora villosa]|nr:MAG: hypothetical protein LQ345_003872 [Seirophora villosa]
MPLVGSNLVSLSSSGPFKMEERKRPASNDNDNPGPPLKRQATLVNGAGRSHPDEDMPWQDDLERFQKEAIWRQMQEQKRQCNTLEIENKALRQSSEFHDDHLRAIDAWFAQLLDEISILANGAARNPSFSAFPSALLTTDNRTFEEHLQSRSKEIKRAISNIFSRSPQPDTDVADLKGQLARSLATEKGYVTALEKSRLQKEQLEGQLDNASLRYMVAEKKVDRQKSATVARLEAQAIAGGRSDTGSGLGGSRDSTESGAKAENGGQALLEAERARHEAVAASTKQQEQIEALETENEKSRTENTALSARLTHLSNDDYSKTDLFKLMKSQHEDNIKRINDLEARLTQLRDEAEKDQTSRTAFRIEVEKELQPVQLERDSQLAQAESDLARVRNSRDEYLADNNMRKAAQAQERTSMDQIRELANSKDERIKALESEVGRLRPQLASTNGEPIEPTNSTDVSIEDLLSKCAQFERQKSMLDTELESMKQAYTKASAIASQKVASYAALEEKVVRAQAEKSKADQKYFGAMKLNETRAGELRTLRGQNSKSSEAVAHVKEAEAASRAYSANLEKQIGELNGIKASLTKQLQATQQSLNEKSIQYEGLKTQVEELKKLLTAKEGSASVIKSAHRKAEVEIETLRAGLEKTQKQVEEWRSRSLGNNGAEFEALRAIAICTVCRTNFKDTAIVTCGHVFCKGCVEERRTSRSRKCPNCNKSFGQNDTLKVTL